MVLGKLTVLGRPTNWMIVRQGLTALAVGAFFFVFFSRHFSSHLFFPLSPSLWDTVRYRLKYCLKGPFNQKQPTNQPNPHWLRSFCNKTACADASPAPNLRRTICVPAYADHMIGQTSCSSEKCAIGE